MSLKGIISISGAPGLYKVLAQTKSGFIVESLVDKKRMPVSSNQKISMLEDISVFTNADDMPLRDVMLKIKTHAEGKDIVDPKSDPSKLKDFFKTVVPDFDSERVYPSDIKKIINWFHLVKEFVADEDEVEVAEEESTSEEEAVEETPEKETKAAPKKKRAAKSEKTEDEPAAEKTKAAPKARKKKEN